MDWIKCNICFENYNETSLRPRSLNCGHTFCERCLNITIQNATLRCPQCRKIHEIGSALDLPINFTLEELLSSLNHCSPNIKEEVPNAGMCTEHPGNERIFRCSSHNSWVCEQCIENLGDHPKHKCRITSFKEEIEDRRQEDQSSLNKEGKFCDVTLSLIEKHISYLSDERKRHVSLVNTLQNLENIHEKEEELLQNKITYFQQIIKKGNRVKQILLDVEGAVLNALTLDDSDAAREMVKNKKAEARNWAGNARSEAEEGKCMLRISNNLATATETSLKFRESDNKIKSIDNETMQKSWNKVLYDIDNGTNLLSKISGEVKEDETTTWVVKSPGKYSPELAGQLISCNDRELLHSMMVYDSLPKNAIIFDFHHVMTSVQSPLVVFLTLSHCGSTLGNLHIRLNDELFPNRAHQFVMHAIGTHCRSGYKGAGFDIGVFGEGYCGENVVCGGYNCDESDHRCSALYDVEMGTRRIPPVIEGNVYGWPRRHRYSGGFRICTISKHDSTWPDPVIGYVISGLQMIKAEAAKGHNYVRQIVFSDCGLIVGNPD